MTVEHIFRTSFKPALAICCLTVVFAACVEKETWDLDTLDSSVEMQVSLAVPIADGTVSFLEVLEEWELLDSVEVKYTADSLLYLDYWNDYKIEDFINLTIPDQERVEIIQPGDNNIPPYIPIDGGASFTETRKVIFSMDVDGGEVYSVIFETGTFEIEGVNGFATMTGVKERYEVTIPALIKDDLPFVKTFVGTDFTGTKSFDVEGYKLSFDTSQVVEQIVVFIEYTVSNETSDEILLPLTTPISFTMRVKDAVPRFIVGYMGTKELVDRVQEVKVPVLSPDYVLDSTIFFYDPKVEIYLQNWIGIPFNFTIKSVQFCNTETDEIEDLGYEKSIPVSPAAAERMGSGRYTITPSIVDELITKDNSTIDKVLNKVYNKLKIAYCVTSNPDGQTEIDNFLKVDAASKLVLTTHTIMSAYLKVDNFHFDESFDFDFQKEVMDDLDGDTASLNNLDTLMIDLTLTNRIPFEIIGQLYVVDSLDMVLDSLFENPKAVICAAAEIDDQGRSTSLSGEGQKSVITIAYDHVKYEKLKGGKKLKLHLEANSTDRQYVQLFARLGLDYTIGFYLKGVAIVESEDE